MQEKISRVPQHFLSHSGVWLPSRLWVLTVLSLLFEIAERRAALNKGTGKRLWRDPRVRAEIERQLDLFDKEMARLLVERSHRRDESTR